jgi:hypothetical protein
MYIYPNNLPPDVLTHVPLKLPPGRIIPSMDTSDLACILNIKFLF